jgi:hypothetical protein
MESMLVAFIMALCSLAFVKGRICLLTDCHLTFRWAVAGTQSRCVFAVVLPFLCFALRNAARSWSDGCAAKEHGLLMTLSESIRAGGCK